MEDHERVTDLLTVFLGLGVFNANTSLRESFWSDGAHIGYSIGRQGYLAPSVFGYALGVFAHVRCEADPRWTRYLRADAPGALRGGRKPRRQAI